jgi:glycosyltransferase involved in cell wall biosynthesis
MISVLILTLNEELNLPDCLKSVSWSDDIVIFDSYSSDRTVEIAKAAEARVYQRKFDNYASQRSAALNDVEYKYPWVLMIDADERVTDKLKEEIIRVTQNQSNITLWRIQRKNMFFGGWLKRSSGYAIGRLFRTGCVRVEREVNEEYHTDGEVGHLQNSLLHYPFNKGLAFWLERHNRYSTMEALAMINEGKEKLHARNLFSLDPMLRRKCLKRIGYRMPFRPFWVFCYFYFYRLGFLDGVPGLTYCRLRSMYEYMIDLKVKELRRREKGLPV